MTTLDRDPLDTPEGCASLADQYEHQGRFLNAAAMWRRAAGVSMGHNRAARYEDSARRCDAEAKRTQAINIGDAVRSFDFPHFGAGMDLDGPHACYVEGVVESIGAVVLDGCSRYKIKVTARKMSGRWVLTSGDYVYPPVNGTPTTGGRVCDGVKPIPPPLLSCGCCTVGCVCRNHMDIPRGILPQKCSEHSGTGKIAIQEV